MEIPYKNGDILVLRNWILIFAGILDSQIGHIIMYHAVLSTRDNDYTPYICVGKDTGIGCYEGQENMIRYATNNEKKILFDTMAKYKNAYWKPDTLEVVNKEGEHIRGRLG